VAPGGAAVARLRSTMYEVARPGAANRTFFEVTRHWRGAKILGFEVTRPGAAISTGKGGRLSGFLGGAAPARPLSAIIGHYLRWRGDWNIGGAAGGAAGRRWSPRRRG
jgi:hypothetical protein